MTLPHSVEIAGGVYPQHPPTPSPVTDTISEKSCTLEGSVITLLRVSVVTLTDKQ